VAGMGEVIGLNYLTVFKVMDEMGISDNRWSCIEKVTWVSNYVMDKRRKARKKD